MATIVLTMITLAGCAASETVASARCGPLLPGASAHLSSALRVAGSLESPVFVQSSDFNQVYMVAASIDGETAVWAMNGLDGSGLIYSLNDHAFEVSGMGRGEDLADPITDADDGAAEAASCVVNG